MFRILSTAFSGVFNKVMLGSMLCLGAFSLFQYIQNTRIASKLTKVESNFTVLDGQHKELKNQYDGLEAQLKQLQQSNNATADILDQKTKIITSYKNKFDSVGKEVTAKIDDIKNKYQDKEKTVENKKAEEDEISNVRINGLWATYCANSIGMVLCNTN